MTEAVDRMQALSAPHATVADKIRALAAAGYPRADIARFLGKRYQHIRNVLEDDAQRNGTYVIGRADLSGVREPPPGVEDAGAEPYVVDVGVAILRLPVREDGALALPEMAMQALGLRAGGVAIAELEGDRLTIFSVRESVRRIQAMTRELIPGDHSLADGLIAERREEVARENAGPEASLRATGGQEDG
jgi:hypothetical protein